LYMFLCKIKKKKGIWYYTKRVGANSTIGHIFVLKFW